MRDVLKEKYFGKANNLMERLLDEEPEDDIEGTDEIPTETDEEPTVDDNKESGQSEQIEVFFSDLDEKTQKTILDALKENLNTSEDDAYAHQKIVDALSTKPIMALRAEEIVRKLNIDI